MAPPPRPGEGVEVSCPLDSSATHHSLPPQPHADAPRAPGTSAASPAVACSPSGAAPRSPPRRRHPPPAAAAAAASAPSSSAPLHAPLRRRCTCTCIGCKLGALHRSFSLPARGCGSPRRRPLPAAAASPPVPLSSTSPAVFYHLQPQHQPALRRTHDLVLPRQQYAASLRAPPTARVAAWLAPTRAVPPALPHHRTRHLLAATAAVDVLPPPRISLAGICYEKGRHAGITRGAAQCSSPGTHVSAKRKPRRTTTE